MSTARDVSSCFPSAFRPAGASASREISMAARIALRSAVLAISVAGAASEAVAQQPSTPATRDLPQPPKPEDVAAASVKVKKVFADELSKATSPRTQLELARVLRAEAGGIGDPAEKWSLLAESVRLSEAAGSLADVDRALADVSACFSVNHHGLRQAALRKLAGNSAPDHVDAVASALLEEARHAIGAGLFDDARALLASCQALSRKSRSKQLTAECTKITADIRAEEKAAKEFESLIAKQRQSPDDPAACGALGQHLCFKRQEWDEGLELLARGEGQELAALARQDLAVQKDAKRAAAAADAWNTWLQRQKGELKAGAASRAVELYAVALPGTAGLERTRVQKKIQELMAVRQPSDQAVAKVWLASLEPAETAGLAFGFAKDGTYQGKPFTCGGQPCPRSLLAMPGGGMKPATVAYAIPQRARRIVGAAGVFVPDFMKDSGPVNPASPQYFEVRVDGSTLWKSPAMPKGNEQITFDVIVAGGARLELVTMSESGASAFAAWIEPAFTK